MRIDLCSRRITPQLENAGYDVQGNGAHPATDEKQDPQTMEARVTDLPTESGVRIAEVEAEPATPAHSVPEALSDSSPTEA